MAAERRRDELDDAPSDVLSLVALEEVTRLREPNVRLASSAGPVVDQVVLRHESPEIARVVRCPHHVGGDFFSRAYLEAWHTVANSRPDVLFYCYTKSTHFLPPRAELAPNLRVTVSAGTRHDLGMARTLGYPVAFVVFAPGGPLPIDHDDSHAIAGDHDFALLLHGTQPAGSDAAVALQALRSQGHTGYRKGA